MFAFNPLLLFPLNLLLTGVMGTTTGIFRAKGGVSGEVGVNIPFIPEEGLSFKVSRLGVDLTSLKFL